MEQKEIFNLLAIGLINDIPQGIEFKRAVLNILCFENTVEFSSYIIELNDEKKNLEVSLGYKYAKAALKLYEITQTTLPIHKNWNRARFTLFPNAKMEIEYIWDKNIQDEIDNFNNKNNH